MAATSNTSRHIPNQLEIWQWNCRSFHKKAPSLQLFIQNSPTSPDVICLQETGTGSNNLKGYYQISNPESPRIAVYASKTLAFVVHSTSVTGINHVLLEVLPQKRGKKSTFILNLYSPPRARQEQFGPIFRECARIAGNNQLVVLGDMNAPHTAWGYKMDTRKGTSLLEAADREGLSLATDYTVSTRIGNSVSRDTTPDLCFTKNAANVTWTHLGETLGSDHYILSTAVSTSKLRRIIGNTKITNWEAFRRCPPAEGGITNITEWTQHLRDTHVSTTRTIQRTATTPEVDGHLLQLWDTREKLVKRWKQQRLNKKLRLRIASLTEEAQQYSIKLAHQNWVQFCASLQGTLSTSQTWSILRSLIDPDKAKSATNRTLQTIAHQFHGSDKELTDALWTRYIGDTPLPPCTATYNGLPNPTLDAPITLAEVRAAAHASQRNTAPGADKITNAMIRNLSHAHIKAITDYLNNELWEKGTVPQDWRHAEIITIPKPGKKPTLDALRPISLTSCLGKLYERVIHTRLQNYIEDNNLFPSTMIGFRPGLSAQDAFLLLREEVLSNIPRGQEHLILALDLKGAFDNISHEAILQGISDLNGGEKIFAYVRAFLTGRTATIGIGQTRSDVKDMPHKGTPQGAIISPLLFNIAMRRLAHALQELPSVGFTLYADDITIWATKGSLGQKETTLQSAARIVENFASQSGLRCAPEKSEVIRVHGPRYVSPGTINLSIDGQVIREVNLIRILGLWIQSNLRVTHTIQTLKTTTGQIARMISRITKHRQGMREEETLRLVQALVLSRITYGLPFHTLTKGEEQQIDTIIKGIYKTALNLPKNTSTERLNALGIFNTFSELVEAIHVSQTLRLQTTQAGQALLRRVGSMADIRTLDAQSSLEKQHRQSIRVAPIPKHMLKDVHTGRRRARVSYLRRRLANSTKAVYVDAAAYADHNKYAVAAVDHTFSTLFTASVIADTPAAAETVAVAIAIRHSEFQGRSAHVITDSQQACRNFLRGRVPKHATRVMGSAPLTNSHEITWTPGHEGLEGNERAHALARGIINRAGPSNVFTFTPLPSTYNERLEVQRLQRRHFPPPHRKLDTQDSISWRQIQTNTFPNLHRLHLIYPTLYADTCPWCQARPTLFHISWGCGAKPSILQTPNTSFERWEALLSSGNLEDQRALIQQVRRAAQASGALE